MMHFSSEGIAGIQDVPSRMLNSSRYFVKIPGRTRSGPGDVRVSDDRCFVALFSASGCVDSGGFRSWRSQFSGVKTFMPTFMVIPGNGGLLVVSFLKAFFGDWTFSRVKARDLTMIV